MRRIYSHAIMAAFALVLHSDAAGPNLLPNGDAEDEFVNLLRLDENFATHIEANHTNVPAYWQLSEGAARCPDEKHAGNGAVRLEAGAQPATATLASDYWRVKDPSMPFGLPLVPGKEVHVSFYYRTSPALESDTLSATITLGTIAGLPSESHDMTLPSTAQWKEIAATFSPAELRWGAQVVVTLKGGGQDKRTAWIDDVQLSQDLDDSVNLAHNASFEEHSPQSDWPSGWEPPVEDEWVSWVGADFRPPQRVTTAALSGAHSMRATVTYADVSGLSQEIRLDQDQPRPVAVGVWSKLENSVGNRPPGYFGSDNLPNLTIFVYHTDGTMQEVSPTFCLGESDHGWEYRRGGFAPQKPVEKVRVQVTLLGSEGTTSLWLDDFSVHELSSAATQTLPSERYAAPRTLSATWGALADAASGGVTAANDRDNLYLSVPRKLGSVETLVYLNTHSSEPFIDYDRFLYDVVRFTENGDLEFGNVAEKQGYTANGGFAPAAAAGLSLRSTPEAHVLTVPFRSLRLEGPPQAPIGFNVEWRAPSGRTLWTGNAIGREHLGRLIAASPPGLEVRSLKFGKRWELEPGQSQDFVTHPPIYAGMNTGELTLASTDQAMRVEITAGVAGQPAFNGACDLAAGESKTVEFTYDAGTTAGIREFGLSLRADGAGPVSAVYPLDIPPALELVLDQEFYFPEEGEARIEVHNRLRPLPPHGAVLVKVKDEVSGAVVVETKQALAEPVSSFSIPLDKLRINQLPVQDYTLEASYEDENGGRIASRSARFGRIEHAERRPLPPIGKVAIDDKGRLVINDDFRFFPIVPSLSSDDYREALELGANINRAYYIQGKGAGEGKPGIFETVDQAWGLGAYTLTIGPGPESIEAFDHDRDRLLTHPGFLGCYAKQFYYWRLSPDLLEYRKKVEALFAAAPASRLLVWGHHDSSFLYDHGRTDWPSPGLPVGYCYTKIMGRPGPAWRNSPFLTRTEQVLDPHRFKLGEVNYYVAWHDDEIVPEHFKTYRSIRADDWRGVRNESYLAIIYGANGLYHYICVQKGGLQRLRGWFQELNYLWPAFVQDDAVNRVTVSPANSSVEVRLKRWNGKYYLLTANAAGLTQHASVSIEGLDGMRARKLFDLPGAMAVQGNVISDVWNENDAFVYEIDHDTR